MTPPLKSSTSLTTEDKISNSLLEPTKALHDMTPFFVHSSFSYCFPYWIENQRVSFWTVVCISFSALISSWRTDLKGEHSQTLAKAVKIDFTRLPLTVGESAEPHSDVGRGDWTF